MALLESLAKRKISRKSLFDRLGWFAFILPVVLGVLIFSLYPMVVSLYYSFFKTYTGTTDLPFWTINGFNNFGLFNYKRMFTIDSEVWQSFGITFIYAVVSVPVCLILSFLIALLLNSKVKGIGIFRVIYYLPVIIPTTINGLLWADFYDVRFGLANQLLTSVGCPPVRSLRRQTRLSSRLCRSIYGRSARL